MFSVIGSLLAITLPLPDATSISCEMKKNRMSSFFMKPNL